MPVVELYSKDPFIAEKALQSAIAALDLKNTAESRQASQRYRERLQKIRKATKSASRD